MVHAVQKFFISNGLPWSSKIEQSLVDDGYDSVELIKVMTDDEWKALFNDEKVAKQRLAANVLHNLRQKPVDSTKCTTDIPISPPAATIQSTPTTSNKKRTRNHTDNNDASHSMMSYGFTIKQRKKKHKTQHWKDIMSPNRQEPEVSVAEHDIGTITIEEEELGNNFQVYLSPDTMKRLDIVSGEYLIIKAASGNESCCIASPLTDDQLEAWEEGHNWLGVHKLLSEEQLDIEFGDKVSLTLVKEDDMPNADAVRIVCTEFGRCKNLNAPEVRNHVDKCIRAFFDTYGKQNGNG